ncbi:MAG: autotransporter-associated beta strand repeat-containing protein, partial [Akkermansiaceae bacterium]|nr:autotransporter-associated beta strand repeat-containing protein [Akkermansiaceae bacterium]
MITAINPATNQITLSRPLTANALNISLTIQKVANFSETRLFAAQGGTVDVRMRVIDDGGFSLNNEVGAITKVGRGTVELSGSAAGSSDVDGGINLFGGQLVFDYINLQNEEGVAVARDNSRVSGGGGTLPYQLTLGGGKLILRDGDTAGITENMRGTLSIRPGNSGIIGEAGNSSALRLNLGYHNTFGGTDPNYYWRSPDRYAGGTLQLEFKNLVDPDEPTPLGGVSSVFYSQNAPIGNIFGQIGNDAIIPYATIRLNDPFLGNVVDFASFFAVGIGGGLTDTQFTDSSGFINSSNLYDPFGANLETNVALWNDKLLENFGYFSDDLVTQTVGTGFQGTLTSNLGADFRGVRVIRYASNVNNNTINLGTARLVLGTAGPDDALVGSGAPVEDGGAILISNLAAINTSIAPNNPARNLVRDQFITGGSLTSATASTYFSQATMVGPFTTDDKPASTSTDLIIHNYNEGGGVFTIQSRIVNFDTRPLNLVVSGTGTTKLAPSGTSTFSGATYVNDGTLWLAATNALGASTTAPLYLNGGTLEFANLLQANRSSSPLNITLLAGRPLILGGNGGTIRTSAPGTVITFGGTVRAEENLLPLQLTENQLEANIGVGDLIKTGPGRLILGNTAAVGASGWNAYYGVTEILGGALQVNIATANSGILGSHDSFLDGTRIAAGARVDLQMTSASASTAEWLELQGGTIGTTSGHVDGSLNGLIRVTAPSTIEVTQGILKVNPEAGMIEGTGDLTKTGAGTLVLGENNASYSGTWSLMNGTLLARSQGRVLGTGATMTLGSSDAGASGNAAFLMQSFTSGGVFRTTYEVTQNIVVASLGLGSTQTRELGVFNTGDGVTAGGAQNDRYLFSGSLNLQSNLRLSYSDTATNLALFGSSSVDGLRGGNRTIALAGALSGSGNLETSVIQTGGTVNGADNDQIVTFELGGDNSAWTGSVRLGNRGSTDADRQHVLRVVNPLGLTGQNNVTLDFNATLQVAGGTLNIGNLLVGDPVGNAVANGVVVENASNAVGTLRINQTQNETWDVIFRDGITPSINSAFDAVVRNNALNLVKLGPAVVTMTQASTYTGFTQIGSLNGVSGGTLRLGTGGSINPGSQLTVFGGVFELAGANQTLTQPLTLGGGAAGVRAEVRTGASTLTLQSNVNYLSTNDNAGAAIRGNVNMG